MVEFRHDHKPFYREWELSWIFCHKQITLKFTLAWIVSSLTDIILHFFILSYAHPCPTFRAHLSSSTYLYTGPTFGVHISILTYLHPCPTLGEHCSTLFLHITPNKHCIHSFAHHCTIFVAHLSAPTYLYLCPTFRVYCSFLTFLHPYPTWAIHCTTHSHLYTPAKHYISDPTYI
jgi:hypothetical protein